MKNKNFNKALIIGPSGIGTVHLRELLRFGFEEIAFLGKSNSKKRTFIVNLKNNKQIKIINLLNPLISNLPLKILKNHLKIFNKPYIKMGNKAATKAAELPVQNIAQINKIINAIYFK